VGRATSDNLLQQSASTCKDTKKVTCDGGRSWGKAKLNYFI